MDEIVKYTGQVPAKYSGAEMAVIEAQQNSPKILSMSVKEIARQCNGFLLKAYSDAGFAVKGETQETINRSMLVLADSVADDLFTYFKTLSIKEVGLAIKNGIRGEYGEYMGINVKTCHQFFKAYQESFNRIEVIRKQAMQDEPEEKLTEVEISEIMNEACRTSFTKYRESGELVDFGGSKFTHLKKIGLINLTAERYAEIFERAKTQVKAESAQTLFKDGSTTTAGVIANAVIKQIDTHEITKNAARLIALREYFDFLIENEFDLNDLIAAV